MRGWIFSNAEASERFGAALRTRQTIALATGVVMARQGISEEDAYAMLLGSSRQDSKASRFLKTRQQAVARRRGGNCQLHLATNVHFDCPDQVQTMTEQLSDLLDQARRDARLTHGELWLRYFELGGMSTALHLEAFLYGALRPSAHDHNVVAHALNERFVEMGGNHPVAYSDKEKPSDEEGGP